MEVAAVAAVDDWNGGSLCSYDRCTFLRMTHGDNISIAAYGLNGIAYAFALGSRTGTCCREAQNASAQLQHGSFKAETGPGAWLEEQGRQFFVGADVLVSAVVGHDVVGYFDQLVNFFYG